MSPEEEALVSQVKPGMTRAQLDKDFYVNASMWDPAHAPYALRHGSENRHGIVKINVGLRPKNMSSEIYHDPNRCQKWYQWCQDHHQPFEKPDDVVETVSKPYREPYNTSID